MWWEDKAGMKWKTSHDSCIPDSEQHEWDVLHLLHPPTEDWRVQTYPPASSEWLTIMTSAAGLCVENSWRSNVCIKKNNNQSSSRFAPSTHEGQSGKTCHSCYSLNWVYESNLKLSVTAFISMPHYGKWSPLCCRAELILTTVRQPPFGGEPELREPQNRTACVRLKKGNIEFINHQKQKGKLLISCSTDGPGQQGLLNSLTHKVLRRPLQMLSKTQAFSKNTFLKPEPQCSSQTSRQLLSILSWTDLEQAHIYRQETLLFPRTRCKNAHG